MNGECDKEESLIEALQAISRIIDNLIYERSGRQYTLDEEQMSWITYCRDLADKTLRDYKNER